MHNVTTLTHLVGDIGLPQMPGGQLENMHLVHVSRNLRAWFRACLQLIDSPKRVSPLAIHEHHVPSFETLTRTIVNKGVASIRWAPLIVQVLAFWNTNDNSVAYLRIAAQR